MVLNISSVICLCVPKCLGIGEIHSAVSAYHT